MAKRYKAQVYSIFRKPKTQPIRVMEYYAKDELLEAGFNVSNRLAARGNLSGSIPSAYDDIHFSNKVRFHW